MRKTGFISFLIIILLSCIDRDNGAHREYLPEIVPSDIPVSFKPELIPQNKIIHKGIFSPDLKEFYYTISDKDFQNFNVFVIRNQNGAWTDPEEAFFNSAYNEHGMSFSPDGNSIYFSSTRPVPIDAISSTWHIWKSDKIDGEWTKPIFVDIPNLRHKLVSHPSVSNSGTLYFHSSNLDYSEMDVYNAKQVNGVFQNAERVSISSLIKSQKCTPFVSPNEEFLIFATIGNQLDLYINFKDTKGDWSQSKRLNDTINSLGQGNPYVTPDNQFLFFTVGKYGEKNWNVKWVNVETALKTN